MDNTGIIILLCRNRLDLTRRCLDSLLAQIHPVKVLVLDNASTDGTTKYIAGVQMRRDNLFRISYREPEGVAACWNDGLRWAWMQGHKEALVVNSDTELLPQTYGRLLAYLEAHPVGMVTAVGVAEHPRYPEGEPAWRPHPDYSCFMISRAAHRRVPFDPRYGGAYFEDADHHVRMFRAGIDAGSINLGFLHHSSGTLKGATPEEKERIEQHYARNKSRFLRQYGTLPGTKGYEALFLSAEGRETEASNASPAQQEDGEY